ncbi:toxin glutamine deamidase domain-containing protein [Micromonospora sp. WMMA1923]|uniref:toxin glutamine deamidase domain-containing protein n=1 Tax=Micromonospora sp. WMMA1923 TaxID=3404125 RepID=UPI003B9359AA
MTLLPSPIPHPLEFSPWELPGWVYEALDWVVGVQWPDGNERAVWDLADQWYGVAAALAGPRADAFAAAAEVRSGYGGLGAVAEAFDTAWRRVSEGDDAPLPVLLAVTQDLGRLVEECGCDIEGAKIEVWIELGILVTELAILAAVTVLTAGAASPAAAPLIAATRVVVQQIFRRLIAQLARKGLKHGLREAGERAAKETIRSGARGLARRAAVGGAFEAAEESGITLATQAYQNSTGRRHGLDVADVGASAVGGFAGGAAAPAAFLGRHFSGRAARIGEHVGRSMAGEVIAENAASLATGQGLTSGQDAARAAASGVRGSATGQADAALHARLDGRLSALAGNSAAPPNLGAPPPAYPEGVTVPATDGDPATTGIPFPRAGSAPDAALSQAASAPVVEGRAALVSGPPDSRPTSTADPAPHSTAGAPNLVAGVTADLPADPSSGTPTIASGPVVPAPPDGSPSSRLEATPVGVIQGDVNASPASDVPSNPHLAATGAPVTSPTLSSVLVEPMAAPPSPPASSVSPVGSVAGSAEPGVTTNNNTPPAGPATSAVAPVSATSTAAPPSTSVIPQSTVVPPDGVARPVSTGPATGVSPVPGTVYRSRHSSVTQPLNPGPPTAPPDPAPHPDRQDLAHLQPRTPQWYAAKWAVEREGLDRRRYQGYFEAQRAWYEENRRRDLAADLREQADQRYDEARWLTRRAYELSAAGDQIATRSHIEEAGRREKLCHRQRDLAEAVLAGTVKPHSVRIDDESAFQRINDDVADLATGAVETDDRSALTGDGRPPTIDRSRPYGVRGGLRPPLALHQTDLERQMPRDDQGRVLRTADPRRGGWFALANDGGPQADPTRGINCLDCTLSLYETWMHGRPRVSAPRTFDAYAEGDIRSPLGGEADGPGRAETATGGRFQRLCTPPNTQPMTVAYAVDQSYRNLHDQLRLGGHGSFAFVITDWEGGGSHIWAALNQNGTVLYLDPQTNLVSDRPLYGHNGATNPHNVVGIDVMVLAPDGRPMPLGGLQRGWHSQQPDLPHHPPAPQNQGYGEPYLNRLHLLNGRPSAAPAGPAGEERVLPAGLAGHPTAQEPGREGSPAADPGVRSVSARDVVAGGADLDELLAAGVGPAALAAELDPATLQRLVPHLGQQDAQDVSRLFADARIQRMFDEVSSTLSESHPKLAETLLTQLARQPDLVRIILDSPELAASLTARPVTLHNLGKHPQAIQALREVTKGVAAEGGASPVAHDHTLPPVPLTPMQRALSANISPGAREGRQPGFDRRRSDDPAYREAYLHELYSAAAVAQKDLNRLAVELAAVDGKQVGVPGWRQEPKLKARARDKIVLYKNDVSKLCDLAAAKVVFTSLDELYLALRRISDHPSVEIVHFSDRFINPKASGYRDVQMRLRLPNGHVGEFRLHLAQLDEVAVWEHSLFEVTRDLEALARREGRPFSRREMQIVHGVSAYQRARFWDALRSACGMGS